MWKYFKYKFDRALEKSFLNLVFFLFLVSVVGILLLSIVFYALYLFQIVSLEGRFFTFVWNTFGYFIDVGTIAAEGYADNTAWDKFLKIFITLFGVIIFSTFIGIVSQAISARVELLRSGNGPVYENDHIIIFHFTRKLIPLLQELFQAFDDHQYKTSIVVVSKYLPFEAQSKVESYLNIPKNVNLIFRTGYAWQKKIPSIVNLQEAKELILLKPDIDEEFRNIEDCDIEVGKGITTLLESSYFNRSKTNVICEFFTKQKSELYRNYVSDILKEDSNTNIKKSKNKILFVEVEDCRANLISQAIITPDVLEIYDEIFSSTGSDIYFIEIQKLKPELQDICQQFDNHYLNDLNAKLYKSICIGTFQQDKDFEESSKTEVDIAINSKDKISFSSISGFVFIAHDLEEILADIQSIDGVAKEPMPITQLNCLEDREDINAVLISDKVDFNRLNKILNMISNNQELKISSLKLLHDNYINKENLESLKIDFSNQGYTFITEKINFHEFRNESRYPYEILNKVFNGFNKIICIYDDIVDEDDNINNIKDNKVIDTFNLLTFINKTEKAIVNNQISFITEVGGFKTKQLLENNRKFYYNPFFGEDIIDLNTISSKIIASGVVDSRNVQLINSFLGTGPKIKSYTVNNEILNTSFDELEYYFANEKGEIIIGIVDYDLAPSNNTRSQNRKKINQILVNPDQRQIFELSKGDRIITII
ncbi:hypothetical protein N9E52_02395 [Alphaproteobacteria bacterium]|nr:hypothetical protein [Alphaproteobacteria bacterium]